MNEYDALMLLFVFFAGVFDAAQTGSRDYVHRSRLLEWFGNSKWFEVWYYAANPPYNQSFPWSSDFWHTMKHGWIFSWTIAIVFARFGNMPYYFLPFCYLLEGWTFVLFYHYIFKIPARGNAWHFLRSILWPFKRKTA